MIELKALYRKIETCFADCGDVRGPARFAERVAPALLERLSGPLGITAAHLYSGPPGEATLAGRWGAGRPDLAPRLRQLANAAGEPPPWLLDTPAGRAGALRVGDGPLLALFAAGPGELRGEVGRFEFGSALHAVQYAIEQHLKRGDIVNDVQQARVIQASLLPAPRPGFAGFDLCAASLPAAEVGGDLYDFVPLDHETLALAVADASGHGLPAALQARDVAMGLRMGVERDLKLTRMVEKLNRIIHRSGLVSRFVSLVFGELEANGNFIYVNAGHPPALLLDDHGLHELSVGGPVLGPLPDAAYKMGFAHVDRGAALALYSDGVVECRAPDGTEFGGEGVRRWLEDSRTRDAGEAVADLVERLRAHHGRRRSFDDDVTVLLARRPG